MQYYADLDYTILNHNKRKKENIQQQWHTKESTTISDSYICVNDMFSR